MKTHHILSFIFVLLISFSCNKFEEQNPTPDKGTIGALNIPASFNFKTTKEITLTISDTDNVSYDIYTITNNTEPAVLYVDNDTLIDIDATNQLIASGRTKNGSWRVKLTVPGHQEYLYIKRKDAGAFKAELILANRSTINYQHSNLRSLKTVSEDVIYAVNGSRQAFSINAKTGETTLLKNFEKGAYACAVDKANNVMYIAQRRSPYKLREMDLSTGNSKVIGNLKKNFDRMDYDPTSGILYMGRGKYVYTYDPFTAKYITKYKLVGPNANLQGGDLCYAGNNTFYFTSVSKKVLYKGTIKGNKILTETITNNLPTTTTSADLGSDGFLYYATNASPSKVYKVNVTTGKATYLYKLLSSSGQKFRANDFGILEKDIVPIKKDTDGDGVPDETDEYPNDITKAYNIWTPGEHQNGTLAFEDLWPSLGDYDFNDLIVYYKIQQVTNADNEVVEINAHFLNRHKGASLVNGFGFELNIKPNAISSVTGNSLTDKDIIKTSGNGTEANQDKAVIIVYDNGDKNLGIQRTVNIKFNQPIEQTLLGDPPFNPFLIKNQDRNYEIHLPNKAPTTLADEDILGTYHDNSNPTTGRYYKTEKHLPWAINIPIEFVWPLEKREVIKGYLKFKEWAESGGTSYPDWYLEKAGYRDETFLDVQ